MSINPSFQQAMQVLDAVYTLAVASRPEEKYSLTVVFLRDGTLRVTTRSFSPHEQNDGWGIFTTKTAERSVHQWLGAEQGELLVAVVGRCLDLLLAHDGRNPFIHGNEGLCVWKIQVFGGATPHEYLSIRLEKSLDLGFGILQEWWDEGDTVRAEQWYVYQAQVHAHDEPPPAPTEPAWQQVMPDYLEGVVG